MGLVKLWQHQKDAFERFKDDLYVALFWSPGTGKTLTAIEILRYKFNKEKRVIPTLILAPCIVLENWKNEWKKFSKIESAKVKVLLGPTKKRIATIQDSVEKFGKGFIAITNYEALAVSRPFLESIQSWAPEVIVFDECFDEDTLVDTRRGPKKIKHIRAGDKVLNCMQQDSVLKVIPRGTFKKYVGVIYNGTEVYCSCDHLFFTKVGWKKAIDLEVGDELITTKESVRILWKAHRFESRSERSVLQQILFSEMANEFYRFYKEFSWGGKEQKNFLSKKGETKSKGFYKNEEEKPNEKSGHKKEGKFSFEKNQAQTSDSRRQWERSNSTTENFIKRIRKRLGSRIVSILGEKTRGLSDSLQNRFSKQRKKDSNRSRWDITPIFNNAEEGQEENGKAAGIRVEGIKIYKSGDTKGFKDRTFYDLQLEAHPSFSVNGVLVHNSHKIKSYNSKRTKAATKLADEATYKFLLTGTPVLNSPMDIFAQFRALDGGRLFGKNYYIFRSNYFYDKNAGMPKHKYFPNWVIRKESFNKMNERIYSCSMRVKKSECLDLPPQVKKVIFVELSPVQRRLYEAMKKDFIAFMDERACTASLAITKGLRLMQIASGFVKFEDGGMEQSFDKTPRRDALRELLEEIAPSHKVIVWCVFKENYEQVRQVCKTLGLKYVEVHGEVLGNKKYENVDAFNNQEDVRVLIGHPGAGGVGINLIAASYSIYFSRNFSLEQDIQSEARNYRGGSEIHEKITRIDLVAKDTMDELVAEALKRKEAIGEKILHEWRDRL